MAMRNLVFVGLLTWGLVAAPHVQWAMRDGMLFTARGILWLAALLAFPLCFWLATRDSCSGARQTALIAVQSALALFCVWQQPGGFLQVLLVIVAGELGRMRTAPALGWIAAQSALLGALTRDEDGWIETFAYVAFQLFGFFTARIAVEEREAKQALAEANAELRVATGLLDMNSRAEERLRIARDLHDLIGHHLTALSLNLEVASHLAEGEARAHIEKSQALTKRLLSDVRDVVSRLRENEPVDLAAAMQSLRDVVATPAIRIDASDLAVSDPAIAETALRAVQEIVTNAVRHSGAKTLRLKVANDDRALSIDAQDDGVGTDRVQFGNGLSGMRERIASAGGTLEVESMRGRGFEVRIRLPLARPA
ncbi:MAG TPA: sensor histidine kinase [Thermoanaerobaculia bacterium]|nr:sensor histidine kinase [Thermoanaerobaculia bacterium]